MESKGDAQVTLNLLDFKAQTACQWDADELQRDFRKLIGKLSGTYYSLL